MKILKSFIRESIDHMLTFKGGKLAHPDDFTAIEEEDKNSAVELLSKSFPALNLKNFTYKYYYESSPFPEGVVASCMSTGSKYLVTHQGDVVRIKGN